MTTLPPVARAYVGVVVGCALVVVAPALLPPGTPGPPIPATAADDWPVLVALAVLYVFFESFSAAKLTGSALVSVGFPIALAGVLLLPPSAAALVCLLGALARQPAGRRNWVKGLFNGGQLALSAAAAGLTYRALGGDGDFAADRFPAVLLPVTVAATVFAVVNGVLLVGVLVTAERQPAAALWRSAILSSLGPYLGQGLLGLLMAVLWTGRGPVAAALVLLPLSVARWANAQREREQAAYEATIRALVQAVETKDPYTRGHSERVAAASVRIAREIGMAERRLGALRYAGILHDVGKISVPTRVLRKTGRLTDQEFAEIKLHPVRGVEVVRDIDFLDEACAGIMHHHERLDGRGYPMGLAGDRIPEFARVIAVADAFDAMTSTRSYRAARRVDEALAELRRCAGSQFDPTMVDALVRAVRRDGWTVVSGEDLTAVELGGEDAAVVHPGAAGRTPATGGAAPLRPADPADPSGGSGGPGPSGAPDPGSPDGRTTPDPVDPVDPAPRHRTPEPRR